jgi:hypothetical protein
MPYCGRCLNVGRVGGSATRSPLEMKRTQSARVKAPSKGIGEGVATFLRVYRSRSFMKTCQAGRGRVPPW